MKVILAAINAKYIHSNLALYTLTASTTYPVQKKEYTINQLEQEILMDLYREKPDVLAFSVYIWNVSMVVSLSKEIKKLLPGCSIIVGGPEVSYEMETFLKENPQIDLILYSEGESTFAKVVEAYEKGNLKEEIKNIASIAYREDGRVVINPTSSLMDMNGIPFVYENMENFEHKIIYYESSRGCPFSCSYCLSSIDKKVRFRDMAVVKKELQFFLEHKVPQVKFVDRTFNCNHKHAMEIWEYIQSHDNGITNFHFEIAADLLTKDELEILKKMRPGLVQLEIGVQSTNEKTIEEINRKMDLDRVKENVEMVRSYKNIHQHLDLIAGLPYEDYETFQTSFNEVYRMKPEQLQLGFLKVLKGSKMYENREVYGLIYQDKAPYEVFCTKWISYDEIIRLKQVEEVLEVYYNSSQFKLTLSYLLHFWKTPFSFYEQLGDFYEKEGYFSKKHTRIGYYENLLAFVKKECQNKGIEEKIVEELMIYDLYARENLKTRPSFGKDLSAYKQLYVELFQRIGRKKQVDSKWIGKRHHIEHFSFDVFATAETGSRTGEPMHIYFDYDERNPLTNDATYTVFEA
ncbi:MAG: B12-binding domain-containing radical SAM protein [Lachnospiraceae bacterium]|nr:B12-binding domain-containing radical SAM protein [Lachnospiraceae bacterium]